MRETRDLLARLRALGAANAPAAVVSIVAVDGSAYRREGARLVVEPDGALTGVLSGGCVERALLEPVRAALADGAPRTLHFDLAAEEEAIWGFGLGCAGAITLLIEPLAGCAETLVAAYSAAIEERQAVELTTRVTPAPESGRPARVGRALRRLPAAALGERVAPASSRDAASGELELVERLLPPVHLAVVGAERDVTPLLRLAGELGWVATVVDPRPTAEAEARLAPHARYLGAAPRRLADTLTLDARTAVLLATHRYLDDLAYLGELRAAPIGYLGLLGPTRRRDRLLADLARQQGADGAAQPTPRGPAGLDLGGRTPHEIALAVVAEIQAALHGGDGRPLAERGAARQAAGLPR